MKNQNGVPGGESAFGEVAYFRYCDKNNDIKTSFILLLKNLSLPRLELMRAIVAARLCKYLSEIFSDICSKIHLWSDSSIVIHWIKNNSGTWKPFVSNRISEIHNLTNLSCWQHCPGKSNSAVLLTRGFPVQNLRNDNLCWYGPKWMRKNRLKWSKLNDLLIDDKFFFLKKRMDVENYAKKVILRWP
ncbi:transposable element Tcb2 transposase [Trichonephila inaurata madagascariensis]|uniref:Transposable element Tcb2 transposase n=1 Tax=Trichonephila inaurata madagascariensis TaxID=2747483 RepID=A0A8X6XAQ2_9ARAC|nr:transposable element Tcb2 transposase [Trichonephila inaurata madagascariensis]